MSTRFWVLSLLGSLAGCAVPDAPVEPVEGPELATGLRFERLARLSNPGMGVVARDAGPGAWLAMDGVLAQIDGADAEVVDTLAIGGTPVDGLELLDRAENRWLVATPEAVWVADAVGDVLETHPISGRVVAGRLGTDGVTLVVRQGGCELVEIDGHGTRASTLLETCGVGGDLDGAFDPSARVAVDPDTGRQFGVVLGSRDIRVYDDGVEIATFSLERPVVDLTARAGRLLALSDEGVMMQLDPADGDVLAEWRVFRPLDLYGIQLAADGTGIVLEGPDGIVFFALDMGAPGFPLSPGGGNIGVPPGGGGGGGLGGGGVDTSPGQAGAAGSP